MNSSYDHNDKYSSEYIDLASERVGGRAINCSDEWFASCSNLVKPGRGYLKKVTLSIPVNGWMDGSHAEAIPAVGVLIQMKTVTGVRFALAYRVL